MLRSLSSRLVIAFAAVILFSLALSAVAALFLLREQQREVAEERVGRLAEPVLLATALLEQAGLSFEEIQGVLQGYAESFDVRILLVDGEGRVVADTESRLAGRTVASFRDPGFRLVERGGAQFRMARYESGGEELLLVDSAQESPRLSTDRLFEVMTLVYTADVSAIPAERLKEHLAGLTEHSGEGRVLPPPRYRPLVAVPAGEVSSAWQDLVPPLAIAGGIALLASVGVAVFISRSISQPLARITRAAQEMARGEYDQAIEVRSQDEVGRLAEAFNAMARQVSRSHRMMRDLLANVSHELKTPLTSIQGFSQALEEGAISSPEEYSEAGRIINEETQRMRRLVEELIDLSQLESGQAVVQREPIDLADLLRVCAQRFEWRLRDSGASLDLKLPPLPALEGDERRLEQAFSNLIDNAVRHTPAGGTITVRAQRRDGTVEVAVHNTGSYIPAEDLPRVFERFFQVDRNRRRGASGYGLGLAIASEVVQAHRGTIRVRSERETGTEFVVTLPPAPPASDGRPQGRGP